MMMKLKVGMTNLLARMPVIGKYFPTFRPGHYYSPIVDRNEVKRLAHKIFKTSDKTVDGVQLHEKDQLALLDKFWNHFKLLPYKSGKKEEGKRYNFPNSFFPLADAAALAAMMIHFKPKRIIEIGSGYSSAVMLDTNESFLNNSCKLTFIEPEPKRLYSLLTDADKKQNIIIEQLVQDVEAPIFKELEAGDFLFVDSSHVSKTGSDVNLIVFKILTSLKPGVIIHFHDIFFPFEYPENWIMEFYRGFGWNEAYILRAFLTHNENFEIMYWNSFLQTFHKPLFDRHYPEYSSDSGGSIWLRRK